MENKIIGDSCCDYPQNGDKMDWLERVALTITLEGKVYEDDSTLDTIELINDMANSAEAPKSACPSPERFKDAYICDADNVYVVTLSEKLSGSYNSAVVAAEMFNENGKVKNIHVFNSRSAAAAQIAICQKIRELTSQGKDFDEVVSETEKFIDEMHTFFVLEDLSVFQKSGRLSHLQAIITNTLRIRLIMGGTADGSICKLGQALSMDSALKKMTGLIQEKCKTANISGKTLVITHCNCPERAEFVKNLILQQCRFLKSVICRAGGISTIYANDGGIIVSF